MEKGDQQRGIEIMEDANQQRMVEGVEEGGQERKMKKMQAASEVLGKLLQMEKDSNEYLKDMLNRKDEKIRMQEQVIKDLKEMLEVVARSHTNKLSNFDEMDFLRDGFSRALMDVKGELKMLQNRISSKLNIQNKEKPAGS